MSLAARVSRSDVEAAVRALHGDQATLADYTQVQAIYQGFCSSIIRVVASVQLPDQTGSPRENKDQPAILKNTSLIVKCSPQLDTVLEMSSAVFQREVQFIKDAIPILQDQGKTLPTVQYLIARPGIIIMDDLYELGYITLDHITEEFGENKLQFSHVKLVMEKLAQLHVASIDINWLQILPYLHFDWMTESYNSPYITMHKKACEAYASVMVELFPDIDTKISKWLKSEKSLETLKKFTKTDYNNLNILSHGDFWISNIMFKINKNNIPTDVKFIDFQACKFVPPSRDIFYLLYTCKGKSFRDKYETELLRAYVRSFNDALGYERLKLDDFMREYESSRMYGVLMGLVYRTMNCMPDIYPGKGEVMTQGMYQDMISGAHFKSLNRRCCQDSKFKAMVIETLQEFMEQIPKFL